MGRFRYGGDWLCLTACLLYTVNRWLIKPRIGGVWIGGYFDDFLLIPAALPWVLFLQRRLGLRAHDSPPAWDEILLHLVCWSIVCELAGPALFSSATADPWDLLAYTLGGLGSWGIWRRRRNRQAVLECRP